ncbi:MAG: BCCT family transporter, partial [Pseudoclavibacter sp.]
PFVEWLPFVIIVILAIFFITAADSASIVMGMLTTQGDQKPRTWVVIFWGLVMSGIAVVMLLLGDGTALEGLQQLVIVTAVPFAIVLLLAIVAWVRDLRTDPMALRMRYAKSAVDNAVTEGVENYGDDFAIEVVPAAPGGGAGADVESDSDEYTEWYQRTDEDGQPVDYDFETEQWGDGYDPETGSISQVLVAEVAGATSATGAPDAAGATASDAPDSGAAADTTLPADGSGASGDDVGKADR